MAIERIGTLNAQALPLKTQTMPKITAQFDADFLQSMLKSNCIEQHFSDLANPYTIPCESDVTHALKPEPALTNIKPCESKLTSSIDMFVKSIWPYAQKASSLIGLDPKLLIAQAALETGWGKYIASDNTGSSYNLFNIKANPNDESVEIKTTEYINDTPLHTTARFKKYDSYEQSFNDYIHLINNSSRYHKARANTHDPEQYTAALHQAGYATDPGYANKILSIYYGDALQQTSLNQSI